MLGYILICAWSLFSAYAIFRNYSHYSFTDWVVILLIWLIPCTVCFAVIKGAKAANIKRQKQKASEQAAITAQQNALAEIKKQKLADIESLNLIPVAAPHLLLKQSEIAYIEQPATLTITENKVVGTTGRSSGVSMRVAKGMYVRTGGSGGRKIYDDITTTYDGILSVTNQRISFMQERKAFEIQLSKLTNTTSDDKALILQQGNKSYALLTDDADIIECLIRRLCRN